MSVHWVLVTKSANFVFWDLIKTSQIVFLTASVLYITNYSNIRYYLTTKKHAETTKKKIFHEIRKYIYTTNINHSRLNKVNSDGVIPGSVWNNWIQLKTSFLLSCFMYLPQQWHGTKSINQSINYILLSTSCWVLKCMIEQTNAGKSLTKSEVPGWWHNIDESFH